MSSKKGKKSKGKGKKTKEKVEEGPWRRDEFGRILPLVSQYLDEDESWYLQSVCKAWYNARWHYRYNRPLDIFVGSLESKDPQADFGLFLSHVKSLTHVTIYDCYVNNNHLSLLFPDQSVTSIEYLALEMLSNHSEITDDGIGKIVAACPKLHTLAITFLGGARAFGCKVSDISLKSFKDNLVHLRSLSIGVDITSLPALAQFTSLTDLRIRFCEPVPPAPPSLVTTTTTAVSGTAIKLGKNEADIIPIDLDVAKQHITDFSRAVSKTLKSLTVERLVMGWETFLLALEDDSFQSLESLTLSCSYQPSPRSDDRLKAKWPGKALRSLTLNSTSDLTLQPFMSLPLRRLELSCISKGMVRKIRTLTLPDVKSVLFKFLKSKGGHLTKLRATDGDLTDEDIKILAKYCTALVELDLMGCTVIANAPTSTTRTKVSRRASEKSDVGSKTKKSDKKKEPLASVGEEKESKKADKEKEKEPKKKLKRSHSHNQHTHSHHKKTDKKDEKAGDAKKESKTKHDKKSTDGKKESSKSTTKHPSKKTDEKSKKHKRSSSKEKSQPPFDLVRTFSKNFPNLKVFKFSVQELTKLKETRQEIELIYLS